MMAEARSCCGPGSRSCFRPRDGVGWKGALPGLTPPPPESRGSFHLLYYICAINAETGVSANGHKFYGVSLVRPEKYGGCSLHLRRETVYLKLWILHCTRMLTKFSNIATKCSLIQTKTLLHMAVLAKVSFVVIWRTDLYVKYDCNPWPWIEFGSQYGIIEWWTRLWDYAMEACWLALRH